ncbi:hypothetical protein BO78DRAFT_402019 [Aspergillus sclerotiicarbonarius CBS 121057]|uniref:N-acetyltransferase domain-containing protein n=1 Tax=Aspergillus sclerotiicarbonarius (strain CBS 121057 / IBT 28362) TaxID=1448318 RepID=A0A319E1Z9_ASPSB|nr:hypothetical protein BO78DRAFT_402019 [Aspergillus sclerotiicarbonarius CBS 121057]
MTTTTTTTTPECHLTPLNLQDHDQYTELHRQRILCGWDSDISDLDNWKEKQEAGLKGFFWIMISNPDTNTNTHADTNGDKKHTNAGHISLDAYTEPPDADLARADKSVLVVQNFFILPEYQSRGLGRKVMGLVEEVARTEPYGSAKCRAIALTALSKRYWHEEKHVRDRLGPGGPPYSNQEWYERLGYVAFKEEDRYEVRDLEGQVFMLKSTSLRKEVYREC